MTGERLEPCWSCGSTDLHIYKGHRGRCVRCFGCGMQGVLVSQWQARSLPAALDRVIAEVEARLTLLWKAIHTGSHTVGAVHRQIERLEIAAEQLGALRAEHSAGEGEDGHE